MHPWELDEYTFIDFVLKYRGYQEALLDQRMADFDIQRWMAYCAIMPHIGKKMSIDKVVPDLYDRKKGSRKNSAEEAEAKRQLGLQYARTLNKNKNG